MDFKVIVDTSIANNKDVQNFLGGRTELQSFAQVADIIIPEMVIEEIKICKRKSLTLQRDSFLSNIFRSLMQVNEYQTKKFDIEGFISDLLNNENFTFSVIKLEDADSIVAGITAYIYSGNYDVAATSPDSIVVKWTLDFAKHRSIKKHSYGIERPRLNDGELVEIGFHHYENMCIGCHGSPNAEPAKGFNPSPPRLAKEAEELSSSELFWITKNCDRLLLTKLFSGQSMPIMLIMLKIIHVRLSLHTR